MASGQVYAPAGSPPLKAPLPQCTLGRRLGGPQSRCGRLTLTGIESRFLDITICSLVAIQSYFRSSVLEPKALELERLLFGLNTVQLTRKSYVKEQQHEGPLAGLEVREQKIKGRSSAPPILNWMQKCR